MLPCTHKFYGSGGSHIYGMDTAPTRLLHGSDTAPIRETHNFQADRTSTIKMWVHGSYKGGGK